MSASLVGSEMCIRDSLDEVNEAARALQTAVNEASPRSPSLHLYVQQHICLLYTSDAADDM
eukprot:3689305-Alexandrium_andersonii.AAC.1